MGTVIFVCFVTFLILFGAYVYFSWWSYKQLDDVRRAEFVAEKISRVGTEAWRFLRPIMQAALVLAIAISALTFFKVDLTSLAGSLQWDIRSLLAFAVVAAFCLAAIGGSEGSPLLKDVALVVVGFYFGGLTVGT